MLHGHIKSTLYLYHYILLVTCNMWTELMLDTTKARNIRGRLYFQSSCANASDPLLGDVMV